MKSPLPIVPLSRLRRTLAAFVAMAALLPFAALAAVPAPGADDGLPDRMKPMQVVVVRDATPGCAPCAEWIAAQGKIVAGTAPAFDRVLRSLGKRRLPVFVDSPGGSVRDAMAIGAHIRALHLDVAVTRTAFAPCGSGKGGGCAPSARVRSGRPRGIGALCASACVLVLAAGEKREAAPWTVVGVHQMLLEQTHIKVMRVFRVETRMTNGVKVEVSRTLVSERPVSTTHTTTKASRGIYEEVAAYLEDMGIGPALMPLMQATPPSGLHRVTAAEARATALVTDAVDGEYVIEMASHAAAPSGSTSALVRSLPEQAFFVTTVPGAAQPKVSVGRVIWTLDRSGAAAVLRADVAVPEAGLDAVLQVTRGGEDASPLLSVTFAVNSSGPVRSIDRIGLPQARSIEPPQVSSLPGTMLPGGANTFQILLMGDQATLRADQHLLEERPWLDIGLRVNGGIQAALNLEHAASGTPLVRRAFEAWQGAPPHVSATATPPSKL